MGKLLNYLGESKVLKRIADVLNVKDVKVNDVSVVDDYGDANITVTEQIQSDWDQTDNTKVDYIKNKPTIPTTTDEKVKQVYTDGTSGDYYFLASNSNTSSTTDETDFVKKIGHGYISGQTGNVIICRKHTNTIVINNQVAIGNNTPDGTAGAVDGYLRLYGKGQYYFQFYDRDNTLTENITYRPRNKQGMLAVLEDARECGKNAVINDLNLIYPPYYHASGQYDNTLTYSSNEETGEYTISGYRASNLSLQLKRYAQGFYLNPGTYKMSGCPAGGGSTSYEIRVHTSTTSGTVTQIAADTGSGAIFHLTDRSLMHITFYLRANTTVNFSFTPKLEKLEGWEDLGSISNTITVDDIYSEYMVLLTVSLRITRPDSSTDTLVQRFIFRLPNILLSTSAQKFEQCSFLDNEGDLFVKGTLNIIQSNDQVTIGVGGSYIGSPATGTVTSIILLGTKLYAKY